MGWPSKHQLRRLWRPFRIVAGFALLGVAVWVVVGKSTELSGASAYLTQLRWEWLALAAVAELACYTALASVERVLLRAGHVPARLGRLTAITFAASAIQSALPVGAAFAGVYNFRQYQWLGADEVLSGWVVVASGAVSFATLAALAGIGLSMAASLGSTFGPCRGHCWGARGGPAGRNRVGAFERGCSGWLTGSYPFSKGAFTVSRAS